MYIQSLHRTLIRICRRVVSLLFLATLLFAIPSGLAIADSCRNSGEFSSWLSAFKQEAQALGISRRAISALRSVRFNQKVIHRDRKQGIFAQDFLTFARRLISAHRLKTGRALLTKHRRLFQRIEQTYGVPGPVLTAFWGLETDFGANNGHFATLSALATLAYDCRRPELFRPQLLDAFAHHRRGRSERTANARGLGR